MSASTTATASAATPAAGPDDIRETMDRFLLALYEAQRASGHADRVALDELATSLAVSSALTVKIAHYLEREGLLDFEHELVDLTVEGILRAESIARGERSRRSSEP